LNTSQQPTSQLIAPEQNYPQVNGLEVIAKREPLTDGEIGNLVAAVGNHENKALLLSAMKPEVVYSRNDLNKLFLEIQDDPPAWKVSDNLPFGYCMRSLAPIGLVAKDVVDPDRGIVGFYKTDLGIDVGDALAGHLLDYSLKHPEISLSQIFGSTVSPSERGARSPRMRIDILGELLTYDQPVNIADLPSVKEGDARRESGHIREMEKNDLIVVNSNVRQTFDVDSQKLSQIELDGHDPALSPVMRQILMERAETDGKLSITVEDMIEELAARSIDEEQHKWLRMQISRIFKKFTAKGALEPLEEIDMERRTKISIDEDKRDVLEECLDIIYRLQTLDPMFLNEGQEKMRRILSSKDSIQELVSKARKSSAHADPGAKAERIAIVRSMLNESQQTQRDIEQKLREQGIKLSEGGVNVILRSLMKAGEAERVMSKNRALWTATKVTEPIDEV